MMARESKGRVATPTLRRAIHVPSKYTWKRSIRGRPRCRRERGGRGIGIGVGDATISGAKSMSNPASSRLFGRADLPNHRPQTPPLSLSRLPVPRAGAKTRNSAISFTVRSLQNVKHPCQAEWGKLCDQRMPNTARVRCLSSTRSLSCPSVCLSLGNFSRHGEVNKIPPGVS